MDRRKIRTAAAIQPAGRLLKRGELNRPTINEYEALVVRVKGKLLATGSISRQDLNPIVDAGANRASLLDLIAAAVIICPGKSVSDQMRSRSQELKSLSMQLRTVADHGERLAADGPTYLVFYSPFANQDFARYKNKKTKLRASAGPFQAMRDCADWAHKQAIYFGRCLRRNSQKEANLGLLWLLSCVHSQTGSLFENQLARLLTDAAEAAGAPRSFTADQLRKMFKRHVSPSPARPDISIP